ncbi:TetR family transcriptional regulator [Leucobacter ruminantium]|uniref:TetR family transcriptional regulator n=1 Tax=Leucobacter ruminantium TaxID=1289170 RepID=A0A939RZN1_9MICO|nr:TetR family transcriptional regulator [Leucobacter ruminantium]MBO1806016.1 TetR family transcriptional regulator [Leucobacter ruminantium]
MRNSLSDVVAAALRVLDEQGLEGCSMRRVAAALDVQPSALYHHVPNKQTLLALMADEIVRGLGGPGGATVAGDAAGGATAARSLCIALREAMLAVRDGADVVATAAAFRLGASEVEQRLTALVGPDGARTLLLYTFGHAQSTQTHRQAAAFGALLGPIAGSDAAGPSDRGEGSLARGGAAPGRPATATAGSVADLDSSFVRGLDIILGGLTS